MVSKVEAFEGQRAGQRPESRVGALSHPWSEAPTRPQRSEIDFLRKELKLSDPQVKVLNWLASIAGENFLFQNGKYRESSCLTIVVPPRFEEHLPAVLVSLGFERATSSPWSNEWHGTFRDERPVATLRPEKGEIDIRRLPYQAPQGRGRLPESAPE